MTAQSDHTSAREAARRAALLIECEPGDAHTLAQLGAHVGLSPSHLRRTFAGIFGMTPAAYARIVRTGRMRDGLRAGATVSAAGYAAGFGSDRAIHEHATRALGMTPMTYRRGGRGVTIHWGLGVSRLGGILVGATPKGVCCLLFAEDAAVAALALEREFPAAELIRDDEAVAVHLSRVAQLLEGDGGVGDIPLDLIGTPFQRAVWSELRMIPRGETVSYAEVAERIGRPDAVRAVAGACADNHAAIVVPCHRVVRSDGGLGGYRWGVERKRSLLEEERQPPRKR